jgi:hypothetical protein
VPSPERDRDPLLLDALGRGYLMPRRALRRRTGGRGALGGGSPALRSCGPATLRPRHDRDTRRYPTVRWVLGAYDRDNDAGRDACRSRVRFIWLLPYALVVVGPSVRGSYTPVPTSSRKGAGLSSRWSRWSQAVEDRVRGYLCALLAVSAVDPRGSSSPQITQQPGTAHPAGEGTWKGSAFFSGSYAAVGFSCWGSLYSGWFATDVLASIVLSGLQDWLGGRSTSLGRTASRGRP